MSRTTFVLALTLCSAFNVPADADTDSSTPASRVTVVFANGRTSKAAIDPRTDSERLWLRFGTDNTRVTRAVGWQEVSLFEPDGRPLSREEAIERANQIAASVENKPSGPRSIRIPPRSQSTPIPEIPVVASQPRTQFVRFDAMLGNWDNDVENDGLLVNFIPYSSIGEAVSARGQLHVELWSMRHSEQDAAARSRGRSIEVLQRWSVPVASDQSDPTRWTKLPFQARHPEFDMAWSSIGLVHIQLVIPGHGVFHDSIDAIRLRPYAPLRDALQMQTGERFLPTELNGRN